METDYGELTKSIERRPSSEFTIPRWSETQMFITVLDRTQFDPVAT